MILLRLAFRNVIAAGMRTWLNTFILGLTIFAMILMQGLYEGMYQQMSQSRIDDELGNGQFWHQNYDPYDPLTLEESHSIPSETLRQLIDRKEAAPVLIVPAAIYPKGRIQSVVLKGIPADQEVLKIPTSMMDEAELENVIPIMIGRRMAKQTNLSIGDTVTARWRTKDGAFDALDLLVTHIFETTVPAVDNGQIWLPLKQLQQMYQTRDHVTMVIMKYELGEQEADVIWRYQSLDQLLTDTKNFVASKSSGGRIFYGLLLFLAMVAIFDTQALSIFKRKKEIGTLVALGMTPRKVLGLFTLEGLLQGILAALAAFILGGPIFWYVAAHGITFSVSGEEYGIALSATLYPTYSMDLIVGTLIFVMVILIVVSYWPARHISRLLPSEALRGR